MQILSTSGKVLIEIEGDSLQNADLRNADLQYANLQYANLHGAYLVNANLQNADLQNANLHGAYLYNADLYNANLQNADLYNANLQNANLCSADMYNADLQNADLHGADLRNADLRNCKINWNSRGLISEILHQTIMAGCRFEIEKLEVVGFISIARNYCWTDIKKYLLQKPHDVQQWIVDRLSPFVTEDNSPPISIIMPSKSSDE